MKLNVKFTQVPVVDYIKKYCDPERFMEYCQECSHYQANYSCPPFDFDALAMLRQYQTMYLLAAKVTPNPEEVALLSAAEEKYVYAKNLLHGVRNQLDQKLLKMEAKYTGRAFFAGSCILCEECKKAYYEPCLYPAQVRQSLEAFGFDMGRTAKELLDVEMVWSQDYLPEYFTLVCGLASNAKIPDFPNDFITI